MHRAAHHESFLRMNLHATVALDVFFSLLGWMAVLSDRGKGEIRVAHIGLLRAVSSQLLLSSSSSSARLRYRCCAGMVPLRCGQRGLMRMELWEVFYRVEWDGNNHWCRSIWTSGWRSKMRSSIDVFTGRLRMC